MIQQNLQCEKYFYVAHRRESCDSRRFFCQRGSFEAHPALLDKKLGKIIILPSFLNMRACTSLFTDRVQMSHPMQSATPAPAHISMHFNASIHAPHAGCDECQRMIQYAYAKLQPTHPLRGATVFTGGGGTNACFNPRTPCGVRPPMLFSPSAEFRASIRAPLRGATH